MMTVVPAPVRLLVIALASGCIPASGPTARGDGAGATAAAAAHITKWVVTAALPRQRISRSSAGLAVGARRWATLASFWETHISTLFYPLTSDPEDPDLLVVDSPLSDEQVMTRNGRFLGVLAQDCEPTARPGECSAVA